MCGSSQRGRLACALLKQGTTVQASKVASRAHVLWSKMLFEFVFIAQFPKKWSREMKRVDVKSTLLVIHAPGKGLANF